MNDLDFIAIATPHFVVHHCHTANGMVRATEIQQVIIVKVPLTIYKENKTRLTRADFTWVSKASHICFGFA